MGGSVNIYDGLLALALIGAAWKALFGANAFGSTVFYVAYGLILAFVWVRLGAPDVALAEAAIGAGLTGALLLDGIRQFERARSTQSSKRRVKFTAALLSACLFTGVAWALWALKTPAQSIMPLVLENMPQSGSQHPVTSVLLNFRAFDTWLEFGVLLVATMAAAAVHHGHAQRLYTLPTLPPSRNAVVLARIMLPVLGIISGAMVWYGSVAPGGAFQGGAILGAAGILLQIAGVRAPIDFLESRSQVRTRVALVLGFGAFLLVAAATHLGSYRMLEYPPGWAGPLILAIEVAATLSIALTLNLTYALSVPTGKA